MKYLLVTGLLLCSPLIAAPPTQVSAPTVLGPKLFRDGDVVEITDVHATSPRLEQGDSITVRGRVRLASQYEAQLGLYLTQTEGTGQEETDPSQTVQVKRGLSKFELKATVKHRGVLHLTVYDRSGQPFGGVYFGTAAQMKGIEGWSLDYYLAGAVHRAHQHVDEIVRSQVWLQAVNHGRHGLNHPQAVRARAIQLR
jgi:hypothetical protein